MNFLCSQLALLASVLLFLLAISVESNATEGANLEIACEMAKHHFIKSTKSEVFSPVLVGTALAMLYAGAKDEGNVKTASSIGKFIGGHRWDKNYVDRSEIHDYFGNALSKFHGPTFKDKVKIANRIYVAPDCKLEDAYKAKVMAKYNSEVKAIDFSNAKAAEEEINDFVKKETNEEIKEIVKLEGKPTPRLMIVNALYFKADWDLPFDPKKTDDNAKFYLGGEKTTTVKMMEQTNTFYHSKEQEYEVIELPFMRGNDGMWLMVVLPEKYAHSYNNPTKEDGLEKVLQSYLYPHVFLSRVHRNMEPMKLRVKLPKFKISTELNNMKNILEKDLKLEHTFTSANLSGMSKQGIEVSEMVHKAVFEIDEIGGRGGAGNATSVLRGDPPSFVADHPFIFFVLAGTPKTVLFSGIYKGD